MIIAIDFDKTLFNSHFPEIGEPNWDLINWCKQKQKEGHILILWTCRHKKNLKQALEACKNIGLIFDYVNNHTKESLDLFGKTNHGKKIYADFYIDDKAYRPNETYKIDEVMKNV